MDYSWLQTFLDIDDELSKISTNLQIKEIELKRWSNYIDHDGDLAKQQSFLTSLMKQKECRKVINKLKQREKDLVEQKKEIIKLIDKFDGLDQKILKLKYVEGCTLEVVASTLGYNYQYIKNKHASIMRTIRFANKIKR